MSIMNNKKLRIFFKRIPLARAVYVAAKELMPRQEYTIPEITPINCRVATISVNCRLNLLIPSLDEKAVFGGIATALRFFVALQEILDCPARIVITDDTFSYNTSKAPNGFVEVSPDEESKELLQIVSFGDKRRGTIPVAESDFFLATAWWTAYAIRDAILWQKDTFSTQNPLLYLIQDYEPCFYPWSSHYLLAESTYHFELPTYAIINSMFLQDYLINHNYNFVRSWCFDPVLNFELKKYLPSEGTIKKKKQILVYGRPNVNRNAFPLIISALRKWAEDFAEASQWTVLAAGEDFDKIDLGNGAVLKSVGKLSLEEYATVLKDSYAGISLMVSPHPSYPPLEMASFGVHTITNCFENKDLSSFSENIISLRVASPENISIALYQQCKQFNGMSCITYNKEYILRESEFGSIPNELCKELHFNG